jgi:AbrB family looped-hinge helix DNA binding protein
MNWSLTPFLVRYRIALPMLQSLTPRPSGQQFTVTVTTKGQLTIPADIRRYLKLKDREKIELVLEPEDTVRIRRAKYPTIASLRGAAGALPKRLTWKKMREIARADALKLARDHA